MKLCKAGLHNLNDPAVVYIAPSTGKWRCGPCGRESSRIWRAAHPERTRELSRVWYVAHPERHRESSRKSNLKWRLANPESHRERAHKWQAENPERHREHRRNMKARRRARLAGVLADLTQKEWEVILSAADHACIYCGAKTNITMDHLIPISRDGSHTANNVAPACLSCNSRKGAKTVAEFLEEAS